MLLKTIGQRNCNVAAYFLCTTAFAALYQLVGVLRFCAAVSGDTRLHQALCTVHLPTAERAYRLLVNALCTTCASRSTALACAKYVFDMLGRSTTPPRSDVVRACAPQSSRACLHYALARGCVVLEAPRRWWRLRGLGVFAWALGLLRPFGALQLFSRRHRNPAHYQVARARKRPFMSVEPRCK